MDDRLREVRPLPGGFDGENMDDEWDEDVQGTSAFFGGPRSAAPSLQELRMSAGAPPVQRGQPSTGGAFGRFMGDLGLGAPQRPHPPSSRQPEHHRLDTPQGSNQGAPPRFAPRAPGVHFGPDHRPGMGRQALDQQVPPGVAGGELTQAVLALVRSQQTMAAAMAQKQDPLRSLLGDDGGDGSGLRLPGAKGAAALELYRQNLEQDPASWSKRIRANATRALHESGTGEASMVDFLTKFMPFGKAGKGMTYVAYLMAHAADQMLRGDWYRAEATILLGLTSFEQALHDNQRWSMAWLLTHLPEPPFHVLQGGVPLDSRRPFGRL